MIKLLTTIVRQPIMTSKFFSDIMINLNVPEYHGCEDISGKVFDQILKAIVKYRNHPSKNY